MWFSVTIVEQCYLEMKCFYIWRNTMSSFIHTCVGPLGLISAQFAEEQWKQKNNILVIGVYMSAICLYL